MRVTSAARATSVPVEMPPSTTMIAPTPYTAAVPSAPTRPSATKNTRPYSAERTPVSRTPSACSSNADCSRSARTEQLDQRRARHVEPLGHLRVHRRVVRHLLPRDSLQPSTDPAGRDDEDRQHDKGQQRELPLQRDHRGEGGEEHDDVAHHAAERAGDGGLGADHVVVEARRDRAGRRAGEEGDRHPLHLGEQRSAKVVDQPFADTSAAPPLHDRQPGIGNGGGDGDRRQDGDLALVALRDRRVDDRLEHERSDERQQRGGENRDEEDHDRRLVRPGEDPDATKRALPELDALHRVDIARHHRMWTHPHGLTLRARIAVRLGQMSMRRRRVPDARTHRRQTLTTAVAAVVLGVALASCSIARVDSGPKVRPPVTRDVSDVTTTTIEVGGSTTHPTAQPLTYSIAWEAVDDRTDVGTITVPVDYDDPQGATLELTVARHKADPDQRIGVLATNNGGPGAAASTMALNAASWFPPEITDRFDVVSWDPRGTGESGASVDCIDDSEYDRFFAEPDLTPDDDAERQENIDIARGVRRAVRRSGRPSHLDRHEQHRPRSRCDPPGARRAAALLLRVQLRQRTRRCVGDAVPGDRPRRRVRRRHRSDRRLARAHQGPVGRFRERPSTRSSPSAAPTTTVRSTTTATRKGPSTR